MIENSSMPAWMWVESPMPTKSTGIAHLSLISPSGKSYIVAPGSGLYASHDQPTYLAEFLVDEVGEWQLSWKGFESKLSLDSKLEVVAEDSILLRTVLS